MNKKKLRNIKIVVTVISDLVTDQRVHKVCTTLTNNGYNVHLIGARRKGSLNIPLRTYKAERIKLFFQKKVWFYAEFNLRLFLKLFFTRADIYLGNDLDVMPATFLAAKLKGKLIIYDTHEYYLGMPELNGKPFIKKVWTEIERFIFPRVNYVYTICESFCELYFNDYGKEITSIRNVPFLNFSETHLSGKKKQYIDSLIPSNKHILLFQGAGINVDRGVEELVLGMQYLDPEKFHLIIVGGGDIFDLIIQLIAQKKLSDRITIIPKVPFEQLRYITEKAHLGLTVDKPNNINHIYGLPNKIFDYLHANVPVLSTRLIELEKIISTYNVGTFLNSNDPQVIAKDIQYVFENPSLLEEWKMNTSKVKKDLNWENEEKKLLTIYKKACNDMKFSYVK